MGNQGLHKLTKAPFKRILPNLCPHCEHFSISDDPGNEWGWTCEALHKILSSPHTDKGKCEEYDHSFQKLDQTAVDEMYRDVAAHREYLRQRKEKRSKGAFWL